MIYIFIFMVVVAYGPSNAQESFEPEIPESCKEAGYCFDTDLPYPTDHVNKLLPTIPEVVGSFKLIDLTKMKTRRSEETSFCENKEQIFTPKVGRNRYNEWYYLLRNESLYQTWRVELCVNPETECNRPVDIAFGYKGTCTQKFISQFVPVLDKDGQPQTREVVFPHTCYCKVTEVTPDLKHLNNRI